MKKKQPRTGRMAVERWIIRNEKPTKVTVSIVGEKALVLPVSKTARKCDVLPSASLFLTAHRAMDSLKLKPCWLVRDNKVQAAQFRIRPVDGVPMFFDMKGQGLWMRHTQHFLTKRAAIAQLVTDTRRKVVAMRRGMRTAEKTLAKLEAQLARASA